MIDEREAAVERMCVRLGASLRMARLHRLMSVEELAEATGISVRSLKALERGDLPNSGLRQIANIAYALRVELEFRTIALDAQPEEQSE